MLGDNFSIILSRSKRMQIFANRVQPTYVPFDGVLRNSNTFN